MLTSEHTGELLAALLRAKVNFGPIAKTKHAKIEARTGWSYGFWYAPLDVIQAATEPALAAEGLLLISGMLAGVDGAPAIASRLMHATSEQWLESVFPSGSLALEDLKGIGGFATYGRRYNILALLDLVGEDDVDASLADGDYIEPRTKAVATPPASTNGHTPALKGDKALAHPTEGHIAALQNLALSECHEDKEVYYQRIRTIMRLKPSASVAPRLLTRTMSMAQYMEIFAYYRRLEEQLAKSEKEATDGTPSASEPATQPTTATTEAVPQDPHAGSAAGSSSAPGPDPDDAAERDRVRLRAEVAGWDLRVPPGEVEHVITHNPYSRARQLLWKCRRQETAAD